MIDCFPFFNELDLLEIRLNSLAPYVEKFVLSGCPVTHSGNPKRLYFDENKERFRGFNITHLIVTDYERWLGMDAWFMEKHQREFLVSGISDVDPECIILLSDLDEIPDLKNYQEGEEGVFIQMLYYYFLNAYTGRNNWHGTVAVRRKNIRRLNNVRNRRNTISNCVGRGWHFSTLGPIEHILYKIESFAHQELNTEECKSRIPENMKNLADPYNRTRGEEKEGRKLSIEMPSGPEWLLSNQNKYPHLFHRN